MVHCDECHMVSSWVSMILKQVRTVRHLRHREEQTACVALYLFPPTWSSFGLLSSYPITFASLKNTTFRLPVTSTLRITVCVCARKIIGFYLWKQPRRLKVCGQMCRCDSVGRRPTCVSSRRRTRLQPGKLPGLWSAWQPAGRGRFPLKEKQMRWKILVLPGAEQLQCWP